MGRFVKGDVVVLPFPYSDLSSTKRRPALVIGELAGDDVILCQITSQRRAVDPHSIEFRAQDMVEGQLAHDSWIRASRIFSADQKLILRRVGKITPEKYAEVVKAIISIIR